MVLDNLSTLCRSGVENEAESWLPVQGWLLGLRQRGISALLVHHAGKSGLQRGTSRREDVLDTVIKLKRPVDYEPADGARFEVHFEKARGLFGDDVEAIEARLEVDGLGHAKWQYWKLETELLEEVRSLMARGLSEREAADELGVSRSKITRLKAKL